MCAFHSMCLCVGECLYGLCGCVYGILWERECVRAPVRWRTASCHCTRPCAGGEDGRDAVGGGSRPSAALHVVAGWAPEPCAAQRSGTSLSGLDARSPVTRAHAGGRVSLRGVSSTRQRSSPSGCAVASDWSSGRSVQLAYSHARARNRSGWHPRLPLAPSGAGSTANPDTQNDE